MLGTIETLSLLLIGVNVLMTYQGLKDRSFFAKYQFEVGAVRAGDYLRLLSGGFLHVDWWHFLFNMYCLYVFTPVLEGIGMSPLYFLVLYFGSLLGGNALALYIHRNHSNYRAVGASGAISGVILAAVLFYPGGLIYLFFVIPIYNWLFAVLYILYSIYGIRAQRDNIGHEAHLGGAVIGILLTIAYAPSLLQLQPWLILATLGPTAIFLYLIITRPELLLLPTGFSSRKSVFTVKKSPRTRKPTLSREEEIDRLLDKKKLSAEDRRRLDELTGNKGHARSDD